MPSTDAADQVADALLHLARRLVGEGDGEDLAGPRPAGREEMGDAGGQHAGLAGAGAGEHQHRPVGRLDRAPLLGVQPVEVVRRARPRAERPRGDAARLRRGRRRRRGLAARAGGSPDIGRATGPRISWEHYSNRWGGKAAKGRGFHEPILQGVYTTSLQEFQPNRGLPCLSLPSRGARRIDATPASTSAYLQKMRELIDAAAAVSGSTRTEFVLESARRRAIDVMLDQRLFVLDANEVGRLQQRPRPSSAAA